MKDFPQPRFSIYIAAASLFVLLGTIMAPAQQLDAATVIQQVNAAVKARVDSIAGYTATGHHCRASVFQWRFRPEQPGSARFSGTHPTRPG
jgi:hypothetical protein